jgi:putative methyltransferase (TIGR04325 family)
MRFRNGRFRGVFSSHAEAMRAVRPGALGGYDHAELVDLNYRDMCEVKIWDYPILFWLERLALDGSCVIDAGGHVGPKFRAFRQHLRLDGRVAWIVYDVPAVVRAGRELAVKERLDSLHFIDNLADAPPADILLASGLLQYLDIPLRDLLLGLGAVPRHLLLNKVATRVGESIVTLESFGTAEVPYQIRNKDEVVHTLQSLGYTIVDEWTIPSLSQTITAQTKHGPVISRGYYARRQ